MVSRAVKTAKRTSRPNVMLTTGVAHRTLQLQQSQQGAGLGRRKAGPDGDLIDVLRLPPYVIEEVPLFLRHRERLLDCRTRRGHGHSEVVEHIGGAGHEPATVPNDG